MGYPCSGAIQLTWPAGGLDTHTDLVVGTGRPDVAGGFGGCPVRPDPRRYHRGAVEWQQGVRFASVAGQQPANGPTTAVDLHLSVR